MCAAQVTIASRLRPAAVRSLDGALAIATGLCLGVGAGLPLTAGDVRPLLFAVGLMAAVGALSVRLLPPSLRPRLALVFLLALTLRFAIAVLLREGSLALGQGGFVTGDDRSYATLSWAFAEYVKGYPIEPYVPPTWNTEVYLFGTYVYLESAIFWVFGDQVLLPIFLNGAAIVAAAMLLFDLTHRLFGRAAAAVAALIVLFYPSLVLWSSVNLKDALALLLITSMLWLLHRFQRLGRARDLVIFIALLFAMDGLRRYVFLLIAGIAPVAVATAHRLRPGHRLRAGLLMTVACGFLIFNDLSGDAWYRPSLEAFEQVRYNMGLGARTNFQRPSPVPARVGDTYCITAPGQPSCDTLSVRTVPLESRLVLIEKDEPEPPAQPGVAFVRRGEVVVIGPPGTAPSEMRSLILRAEGQGSGDSLQTVSLSGQDAFARTLAYLPTGIAHALFAPFPWAIGRTVDLLTVPETLVWYVLLVCAAISAWRARAMWNDLLPLVLFVLGVLAVFSLAEGNYGTLFRHRSMIIPFVTMLASPTLVTLSRRVAALSGMRLVRTGGRILR